MLGMVVLVNLHDRAPTDLICSKAGVLRKQPIVRAKPSVRGSRMEPVLKAGGAPGVGVGLAGFGLGRPVCGRLARDRPSRKLKVRQVCVSVLPHCSGQQNSGATPYPNPVQMKMDKNRASEKQAFRRGLI